MRHAKLIAAFAALIALVIPAEPAWAQAALDVTATPAAGGGQVYSVPVQTLT